MVEQTGAGVTGIHPGDLVVAPFILRDMCCPHCEAVRVPRGQPPFARTFLRNTGWRGGPPRPGPHRRRLPGHGRTAGHQVTDPELIEIFGNLAFDEVLRHASLDVLTERGVQLPLGGQATTTPATRARTSRTVQEQIAGTERVQRMYASAAGHELHIQAANLNALAAIDEIAPASANGTAEA